MKNLFIKYSSYNVWANKKLFDKISSLSDEQINQHIESSFSTLYKTVLHMLDAESIWWQRIKLAERILVPSENFSGNFVELVSKSLQQSLQWEQWVKDITDNRLQHVFAYQNSKKEQFKQPVYEVLLHLYNHSTYHRGQIVTMLRQLGAENIPQTDFIIYTRTLKK
ncbi:MAG: DinB family protein [Bacteroidota bacterium]